MSDRTRELLDTLVAKGPALRAAGYRSFSIDVGHSGAATITATLAPPDVEESPAPAKPDEPPPEISNPLDDPDTFGGGMPASLFDDSDSDSD